MADLVFYHNPQSRGRIVRWMLEEIGQPYETDIVAYDQIKSERYLAVNPMGKVPAIKHRGHIVTECAAICAYLADVFPEADLGPREDEKADYYRWLFYAAGPAEAAITNRAQGWEVPADKERMFGYGNSNRVVAVLDELFSLRDYVCGDRFTAADVYVGSQIMFPLQFGMLPERDGQIIAQAQPAQPQPA
jgi:glutathione S-transferase